MNRLMTRALLASLVLHGVFALVLPLPRAGLSTAPIEKITVVHVQRIQIVHRTVPAPAARPRATARHITHAHTTHNVAMATTPHHAPKVRATPVAIAAAAVSTVVRSGVEEPQHHSAVYSAAPVPSPSEAPQPEPQAPVQQNPPGGYMPFGAEEAQPQIDAHALQALERLNVRVTLSVVVSDAGKVKSVTFSPALDPALEAQIRALLDNAKWDLAYCGAGIPCEGTATIKL
jgi:hypothetical protein